MVFRHSLWVVMFWMATAPMAAAQSSAGLEGPAEIPPQSYTARQYVDSRGCVYIRAGIDGNVTWVPRVARNRKLVCGFKPSLATTTVEIERRAPVTPRPAPAPAPTVVVAPPPAPAPKVTAAPVVTVAPKAQIAPRKVVTPAPKVVKRTVAMAPKVVVAPATPKVPKGYNEVWEDDRLNPDRGPRTAAGDAQMRLIWTDTVPRRLIDTKTGKDLTKATPQLYYPYTSLSAQNAALARGAKIVPRRVAEARMATVASNPSKALRKSSVIRASLPKSAVRHRYVQIGTYAVPGNAVRAKSRVQGMGFPVRMANYSRHGRALQVVLAGPFASQADLRRALAAARAGGYSDAFTRR